MANFRRSNVRNGRRSSKAWLPRVIILCIILIFSMLFLGKKYLRNYSSEAKHLNIKPGDNRYFIPQGGKGQLIHHKHFSLSYREDLEQSEWVAYRLTSNQINAPRQKYKRKFKPDYDVKTRSAFHRDYIHSGYTRGHLVPAADMAFDLKGIEESYYMSNISPQKKEMNGGIWRELEENVRDWVKKEKELYLISGPYFEDTSFGRIGENKVAIPDAFYKIILDVYGNEKKAIAFLIPNERSEKRLSEYVFTVDQIEEKLGLDFFNDLMNDDEEEAIESQFELKKWHFDNSKYKTRLKKWNNY